MTAKLLFSAVAAAAAIGAAGATDVYCVPMSRKTPRADGVIEAGEYAGAMTFSGAADWRGAYIAGKEAVTDPRRTECAVTWTEDALFIAVRSRTAPGGVLKTVGSADAVLGADSLEFWFNPPAEARNAEFARFGQFQLIADSTGRTYSRHHNPGYGLPARHWNTAGMKIANCIHGDIWDFEIMLPASVFGAARMEPGDWGAVLGRNFRTGKQVQATYMPFRALGGYAVTSEYPVLRLVRAGGAVPFGGEMELLPRGARVPVPGNITVRVRAETPVPAGRYRRFFATRCVPAGYFGVQQGAAHDGRQSLLLFWHATGKNIFRNFNSGKIVEPGEEAVISVNVSRNELELYFDGERLGRLEIPGGADPDALGDFLLGGGTGDAEVLSCRVSSGKLSPAEIKACAQGDRSVAGTLKWYPSMTVMAAALSFPEELTGTGAPRLSVKDSSGRAVGEWTLPRPGTFALTGKAGRRMVVVHDKIRLLPEGRLAPGRYQATLTAGGSDVIKKEFVAADYPWFGSQVGRDDILLPGFEPVKASGDRIECVGRVYEIGANGLPAGIWSLGRQILAAPVALYAVRGGAARPLEGAGRLKKPAVAPSSGTRAVYEAEAKGYSLRGTVEQDGLLRLDLSFPRTPAVDRLYMDIVVKKEFAELFHACGEGIRSNPAGFVPPGTGKVFGSRQIPQNHADNFIPYCWVGTDDRGVCYAADSDRGWSHCAERDAVELLRAGNGDVTIRLNILNSTPQGAGREVTLCLQASPVKPMPRGWRAWADTYSYPCTRAMRNLASNPTWGCYIVGMARYPTFMDFGHVRKLAETVRTGKIDNDYKAAWIARCEEAMVKTPEKVRWLARKSPEAARKTLRDHVNAEFHYAQSLHGRPNPVLYYYTCDADPCEGLYELEAMADEWGRYTAVYGSHQDYAAYYLDKMLEAGMGGVYNDNAFFRCNYDWVAGDAWIDGEGEVHPSFSLWALREHARRQVVAMVKRGLDPWLAIHHTNANILPALGFATNTMGMEWKYGRSDYQERYSPDYIRTVNQGLQGGFYPTSLEGIFEVDGPAERTRVSRTMFAALLPHEIRPTLQYTCDWRQYEKIMTSMMEFGIAGDDCSYTAYWDRANPVRWNDDSVLVSVYRRGGRLLCVIGSYADADVELRLSLASGAAILSARDVETGAGIGVSGGVATLPLKRRDFALVEMDVQR